MSAADIAIIPARGGSKRVPRKNIRELSGKPLIAYTIEAALGSDIFEHVIVSTDNLEIASVAEAFGAVVPFLRKADLADDITPVSAATVDMLFQLDPEGKHYSRVCQLMANCPLRDADDVIASHRQFEDSQAPSQISIVRYCWQNPWWAMQRNDDQVLTPLFPEAHAVRSQDLTRLFCPTGAVWWAQSHVLRQQATFHVNGRTGWEIAWQKGIDIDTEEDWNMVEIMMTLAQTGSK